MSRSSRINLRMIYHEVALTCYLLLFCFIHSPSNGWASAENVPENHGESNEDTPQFHDKMSQERRHLLAHLADRMDLDGEGLRHIQKHLGQQTGDTEQNKDLRDVADGDNAKGIFYFFKFHDYDDNQKLDGLEWMQALTDFHEEDNTKGEFKEGGKMFLEHEAEAIVDELLSKHDKNDDGMIDFIELMNSNVDSIMTELDKMHPSEDAGHAHEQQQQTVEQSSLEQEFNQHQQAQQDHSQQEQNQQPQEDQQQQQDNQQPQEDQQQQQDYQQPQENQQHEQQSQEDQQENQQPQEDQQQEQNNQQQENNQQEPFNSEETQDHKEMNQGQEDSQQQNEPSSLEEEYNRQQQQ